MFAADDINGKPFGTTSSIWSDLYNRLHTALCAIHYFMLVKFLINSLFRKSGSYLFCFVFLQGRKNLLYDGVQIVFSSILLWFLFLKRHCLFSLQNINLNHVPLLSPHVTHSFSQHRLQMLKLNDFVICVSSKILVNKRKM